MSAHRQQVRKKRQVLERVVDVVKVIGKRGLSYRHVENEAAYKWDDCTLDHGNFLELILVIGKYDVSLKEHLDECMKKSKELHASSGTKEVLDRLKLDKAMCIGNSTDGASNMQGQYRGFSALMASQSPTHVHVWCYAHVLNLVLADTTGSVLESGSLFSLLNDVAVFIKDSYQRVILWDNEAQDKSHRRLSPIGETRWGSKHEAVEKVFGHFGKPTNSLFLETVLTLAAIEQQANQKPTIRAKARGFKEGLLKYETVLTAQIFLRVFELTTPLSKYLQTKGMEILSAHRMVIATQDSLKKITRDFTTVKAAADTFVKWGNENLEEREGGADIEVETSLPQKRTKKKKNMAGEMAQDEALSDALRAYEVNVHHSILDTASEAIHRRFMTHGTLFADLACLDPRNFDNIKMTDLPHNALQDLSKCLVKFDSRATVENLQSELKNFAGQWDRLKASHMEEYNTRTVEDGSAGEEQETDIVNKSCASCRNCPLCCFQVLRQFNMLSDAYHILGLAYKYLLTLSLTQVACERTFSTLKFIKSRLRSTLSGDKLETFLLMATEKDVLMGLDSDMIIDRVAEKSELMRKLLL
ncbi:hypothetical protein AAFF_G00174420 [Aldrovandia affinis]|uniref:Zinc finger MYM-type 1-like protein n=1 Tax=Aldrovandia affinis TaxID=143900 RepID=A0AAD7RLP7_9TELE|nr:hypothetical protein AAFF_G00174420 [Aldrovandia affinis]